MQICVVGLGYVGLPLSLQFAQSGATVIGLDVDRTKVDALNRAESYIKHIAPEKIKRAVDAGTFLASTDFSRVKDVEAVIICVPTPLNKNEPDIYIIETGKATPEPRQERQVLESTTYPGTTDEDLRDAETRFRKKAGKDFHLAFSPEREDPQPEQCSGYDSESRGRLFAGLLERPSRSIRLRSRRWFRCPPAVAEATKPLKTRFAGKCVGQ
jgi:UDP-N-acetyl-D-glucosamine dehydrogenase